jgi:hypothetical protein
MLCVMSAVVLYTRKILIKSKGGAMKGIINAKIVSLFFAVAIMLVGCCANAAQTLRVVSCAKGLANPPYVVMDDGWQKNSPPVVVESGHGSWDGVRSRLPLKRVKLANRWIGCCHVHRQNGVLPTVNRRINGNQTCFPRDLIGWVGFEYGIIRCNVRY